MPRKTKSPPARSLYGVHPGVTMIQNWIATLKEKTGRSLDEWLEHIQADGPPTTPERRDWLKKRYGHGTNTASWLAERAEGGGPWDDTPEDYLANAPAVVDAMFAGKAALRPVYDQLLELAVALGDDVKACPCKTIVPIYRHHVIAQIKPTTRTRVDFGLALRDTKATGRLIDTGGFAKKDRITHRIPLGSVAEIDAEVEAWLQNAYEMDG
jgi:Domain of unknown function (DUF5655)/Domain of unknown function (DUF4287)